jgi:hypothetical protein
MDSVDGVSIIIGSFLTFYSIYLAKVLIVFKNVLARKMKAIIILLAALVVIAAAVPKPADRDSDFSKLTPGLHFISRVCLKLITTKSGMEDYFKIKNLTINRMSVE